VSGEAIEKDSKKQSTDRILLVVWTAARWRRQSSGSSVVRSADHPLESSLVYHFERSREINAKQRNT